MYLTFHKIEENPISQKKVPNNFKQIAYIDGVSSWWGPSILDSIGLSSKCYNIFILTFWMPGGAQDALALWKNIYTDLGNDKYGKSNSEV